MHGELTNEALSVQVEVTMGIWARSPPAMLMLGCNILHKALGGVSISEWKLENYAEHCLECARIGPRYRGCVLGLAYYLFSLPHTLTSSNPMGLSIIWRSIDSTFRDGNFVPLPLPPPQDTRVCVGLVGGKYFPQLVRQVLDGGRQAGPGRLDDEYGRAFHPVFSRHLSLYRDG